MSGQGGWNLSFNDPGTTGKLTCNMMTELPGQHRLQGKGWRLGNKYKGLITLLGQADKTSPQSGDGKKGTNVQALSSKIFLWPPLLLDLPTHYYMTDYRCLNMLFNLISIKKIYLQIEGVNEMDVF